jgi:hypothetical protein
LGSNNMNKILTAGPLITQIKWAKSGMWKITAGGYTTRHIFSLTLVEPDETEFKAIQLIVWKFSIMMGFAM